jgi:hypothetical protein
MTNDTGTTVSILSSCESSEEETGESPPVGGDQVVPTTSVVPLTPSPPPDTTTLPLPEPPAPHLYTSHINDSGRYMYCYITVNRRWSQYHIPLFALQKSYFFSSQYIFSSCIFLPLISLFSFFNMFPSASR